MTRLSTKTIPRLTSAAFSRMTPSAWGWLTVCLLCSGLGLAVLNANLLPRVESAAPGKVLAGGEQMTQSAQAFLATLKDADQQKAALQPFDSPERLDWHFIPKDSRKGLQVKHMSEPQRAAAFQLLQDSLSAIGYQKAREIMQLEALLAALEKDRTGGAVRDPERYYFTLFGDVAAQKRWGLSVEGHHLSLNFVVDEGEIVASTPAFFAANPAEVKSAVLDTPAGHRVLAAEELLAFELLNSLDKSQQEKAIFADKALADVRAAGEPHPPTTEPIGIPYTDLNEAQQKLLVQLVQTYAETMPAAVAAERLAEIDRAGGFRQLTFAWAGADRPGIGHYYRIQGPTMLIEFANTQPDAAGNPANHIHCMWRDPRGDFGLKR